MQQSVEDEESWGGSSMALEEMGVTVLTGAYNIESEEVRRRISAADILVIAARVKELLRTGADAPLDAMAVCAGRASALLRGVGRGGPFSATRAVYGTRQTHVFHERGMRVRRGAVTARGAELLSVLVLALWAAG